MDFKLTQEQEMLVEAVKSFVEKELLPYEEEVDRADAAIVEDLCGLAKQSHLRISRMNREELRHRF